MTETPKECEPFPYARAGSPLTRLMGSGDDPQGSQPLRLNRADLTLQSPRATSPRRQAPRQAPAEDEQKGLVHGRPAVTYRKRFGPLGRLCAYLPRPRNVFLTLLAPLLLFLHERNSSYALVSDTDRSILVTAQEVADVTGHFPFLPKAETVEKSASIGGGHRVRYEYRSHEKLQPRMMVIASVCRSKGAAEKEFRKRAISVAMEWGLGGGGEEGVGLIRLDEGQPWADESRAYRVEQNGEVLGYSFAGRVGDRTLYVALRDAVLPNDGAFEYLLASPLESLRGYDPRPPARDPAAFLR